MVMIPKQRRPEEQLRAAREARPPRRSARSAQDVDGSRLLPARLLVNPAVVVRLEGSVDPRSVVGLCRQLCGLRWQACTSVVLDTSGVTAVSPAGMAALRAVSQALARSGHRLWLWATPAVLVQALDVAGVDEDLVPLAPCARRRGTDQSGAAETDARPSRWEADVAADPAATGTDQPPAGPPDAGGPAGGAPAGGGG